MEEAGFRHSAGANPTRRKNRKKRKKDETIDDGDDNSVSQTAVKSKSAVAQCANFVEKTLAKGVNGLLLEFRAMRRTNDFSKMTAFVAANTTGKNRYKDVGCLDNARVVLNMGTNPYIHANYVDTAGHPKKFICTQGPLPSTVADFWTMVLQEKSVAILMLCDLFEQNKSKCAQYIPAKPGESATYGDITVTHLKSVKQPFRVESKLKIIRTKVKVMGYGMQMMCYHFHWEEWPDRGVPPIDVAPMELLGVVSRLSDNPIIVHCSAGVGRTGSIVLLQNFLDVLSSGQPLQEFNIYVEEIRKQRNNSVQTELQYLWVHMVVLYYLSRLSMVHESKHAALEAFHKEYMKKIDANQGQ